MFLSYLILFTALCLSAIAAFYSIAGLTAIFAAAVVPIIIMGSILEIAKLVVTVWLHEYWPRVKNTMKVYLTSAVVVLMFITSMGIFGFLSKAHIQQTAQSTQNLAQIEQIEKEIARQEAIILRAEQTIEKTQTSGTGADQNIQSQIDKEQQRIDTAYDRVQPAIDATNKQLERNLDLYEKQIANFDDQLDKLAQASAIDTNNQEDVKRLQAMVGATPDGAYGPGTARAVRLYKEQLETERADAFGKIEQLKAEAKDEIARLRNRAEVEIDESNKLINRLRSQLGQDTGSDIESEIAEQTTRIKSANNELDNLTEKKFSLETEYRALEAEVGPIKYIAEFIYGEQADKNLLEEAVRWVIIIIVFVFDPLAVMMLLASTESISWKKREKSKQIEETKFVEDSESDSNVNRTTTEDTGTEQSLESTRDQDQPAAESYTDVEEKIKEVSSKSLNEIVEPVEYPNRNHELELYEEIYNEKIDNYDSADEFYKEYAILNHTEKSNDLLSEEKDIEPEKIAKRVWKTQNPEDTIKRQEIMYERGMINELPWADTLATLENEELHAGHIDFGTVFPETPEKGDSYIRVDFLPTKLFKFNGQKWIQVDKAISDSYAYNEDYISHLIEKIGSGEYDPDLLNDSERDQIEEYLKNQDIE